VRPDTPNIEVGGWGGQLKMDARSSIDLLSGDIGAGTVEHRSPLSSNYFSNDFVKVLDVGGLRMCRRGSGRGGERVENAERRSYISYWNIPLTGLSGDYSIGNMKAWGPSHPP
jgi:hypothetical protein